MTKLTVEETNLLSIYKTGDRKKCTECGAFFALCSLPCGMRHRRALSFGRWKHS